MKKIEKLTNMANYVENKLLCELLNEIYHDYKNELKDEFDILALKYFKPKIQQAKEQFVTNMNELLIKEQKNKKLNLIAKKLKQWCDERHLIAESQQKNLIGNVLEELSELNRARNVNEKIDALCDICVFAINACDNELHTFDFAPIYNSCKEPYNFTESIITHLRYHDINSVIAMCFKNIERLGYDPYLCMDETIKEISSRTGHYDDKIGKFIKDESKEAKSKWHKANYLKCKIKQSNSNEN